MAQLLTILFFPLLAYDAARVVGFEWHYRHYIDLQAVAVGLIAIIITVAVIIWRIYGARNNV